VNLFLRNGQGKILLQMRDGNPGIEAPLRWNFFGGGVEGGETVLEAAARELAEEVGIQVRPGELRLLTDARFVGAGESLRPFVRSTDTVSKIVSLVTCPRAIDWAEITLGEGAGLGFFTLEEAAQLDATAETRALIAWLTAHVDDLLQGDT